MQWLIIVATILWIVIQVSANKNKKHAKHEEEAEAQTRQLSMQAAQSSQQSSAVTDNPQEKQLPVMEGSLVVTSPYAAAAPATRDTMSSLTTERAYSSFDRSILSERSSSLTEINPTQRHTLKPSSISGHAHQETSILGFEDECLGEPLRFDASDETPIETRNTGLPVFSWQPDAVACGIVYAEILSKPKALRS